MSKCVYCHERKGKRPCPALGGLICSQCCGEHRMIGIACPADCVYLDSNTEYQQKRAGDRFRETRREFYTELFEVGGEPAGALFNLVEVVTFGYFHNRRDGQDGEVIAAVQTLRRTLSPLHIPAGTPPVFAAQLKKEYEAFAKQQSQEPQRALDQQQTTEVIDRALQFISTVSGPGLQSRRFLTGLIGFIKTHYPEVAQHLSRQIQEGGRIVTPGQFPLDRPDIPESPLAQTHHHHHTHHH